MDHRDKLILALSALVRAERDARDALEAAIASGELCTKTVEALANPYIVVDKDDLAMAEEFVGPYRPRNRLEIS